MSLEVNIKKKLKGFTLQVSFSTEKNTFGILGASGCGKSMTLKCISGIMTPDEGKIILNNRVLFDSNQKINLPPQERNVGYLFQNYALFPNMNVEKNISIGYNGKSEEKNYKVSQMMEMFQLEGLEKKYPTQLSGGQQQRVALARMLIYEPEIMLFDEPFSALDVYLKEELQLQLSDLLHRVDKQALLVTHDRDEAYRLCDHTMVLDRGKVLSYGDTRELFLQPRLVQVARLTGCKNISAIKDLGNGYVEALDWGITLKVTGKIKEDTTHIGIRAHDFRGYYPWEEGVENQIKCRKIEYSESPFEWSILIQSQEGKANIYWKIPKVGLEAKTGQEPIQSKYIRIDPDKILLLTDKVI